MNLPSPRLFEVWETFFLGILYIDFASPYVSMSTKHIFFFSWHCHFTISFIISENSCFYSSEQEQDFLRHIKDA